MWMYDKRFKNQISAMVPIPLSLSLFVPMILEYLLPKLCVSGDVKPGYQHKQERKESVVLLKHARAGVVSSHATASW